MVATRPVVAMVATRPVVALSAPRRGGGMTYSPASLIVGYRPPDAAWAATLTAHGALPDAASILGVYNEFCLRYHLDSNLALAQACHECTYFTSERWRDEWNPAGLGITADNTPPNPFKTPQEGIQAHCEHLCAYAYTADTCPVDHAHMADRRHTFHEGYADLAGLERTNHWANPGVGYVDSIAAIANAVTGGAQPLSEYPSGADLGITSDVSIDPTSFQGGTRPLSDIDWYVIHDTEGHFAGDIGVLTGGSQSGSVHFIVGREPGQLVASVPITVTAWTAGNDTLGARAIQFELSKAPDETGFTDWQYTTLAALIGWCQSQGCTVPLVYLGLHPADADSGPLPDERGLIGHAGVPDPNIPGEWGGFAHHSDPGATFDWGHLLSLLNGAPAGQTGTYRRFDATGHGIDGGIRAWFDASGGLDGPGYPLSEEYQYQGRTTQIFQRAVVQWFPENKGTRYEFQCLLLGAQFAKSQGLSGPGIS